jgi:precorrin-6B methylase 2
MASPEQKAPGGNTAAGVTPERLMQLGLAFWGAKTLLSAVELGVFTELAKDPMTLEALSRRLGLHPRGARDFLDALVALGTLERKDGLYSNAPDADFFLDRAKPSYIGGLFEMANTRLYPFWGFLTEALQTGKPQNETKAGVANPFEALYSDPAGLRSFLQAMTGISMGSAKAIAHKFPWDRYKTFADVGGAQGGAAVQIALAHPRLTGVAFDLPQVKPIFEEYVGRFGLTDRLRFVTGNFFADPLPSADVIVMGHILHDWNLEEKRHLISKAYEAIAPGGALVAYDAMIDDERRHHALGLLMSLNMLVETQGGFDYTGADCRGWMREAGFHETKMEHLVGPESMVVGLKK